MAAHPNRRYFILKSIIVNNLYGVDIMEEAVEICKLRLFLKLVAQVEPTRRELGIEPLPDIDFNIRAGNTLVGYATADEVRRVFREKPSGKQVQYNLMLGEKQDAYARFEDQAQNSRQRLPPVPRHADPARHGCEGLRRSESRLCEAPEGAGGRAQPVSRRRIRRGAFCALREKDQGDSAAYEKWLKSHQPFHWFVEFYGIMQSGGFDVIIGNPPYVGICSKVNGLHLRRLLERLPAAISMP